MQLHNLLRNTSKLYLCSVSAVTWGLGTAMQHTDRKKGNTTKRAKMGDRANQ